MKASREWYRGGALLLALAIVTALWLAMAEVELGYAHVLPWFWLIVGNVALMLGRAVDQITSAIEERRP